MPKKQGQEIKKRAGDQSGQTFLATLAQPISAEGKTALPAGSAVSGTVVAAQAKGKIKGEGELDLTLTSISTGGHTTSKRTYSKIRRKVKAREPLVRLVGERPVVP
jgi:hypothetical protein